MSKLDQLLNISTWVFDLDGTLTVPCHDFDELRQRLGIDAEDDILSVVEEASPRAQEEFRAIISEWEWENVAHTECAPGVHKVLALLHERECKMGILTRNLHEIALATLGQIGCRRFFPESRVLGRNEAPPKPSPEGIYECLRRMDAQMPAVMVGDYLYDLQAGKAANCTTILVGEQCPPSWRSETDIVVSTFEEIYEALSR
ncbi:MAG: HAD family hydrolase [Bradymonadia bacterium]